MPVRGEEMFVVGSFMITFSQLKSNKPNLVSEKIKDETYYRKWDVKNKLISHLALLCRSTGVLGVGESTYSQSSSTLRCRPPKFQNCWHCPRSLRTWTRGSSACTCRSSNWGSAPGRARRPGAGGRSPRYFLRRGRRSAASPWRERLPGVVGVGRFVPAASQPSRRALQRQKVQTCGARQELEGRRAQRAGAGVRGTPAAWPGRKRVPWARVGGVPGGACEASPSAVPTRSSDRSISQRGRTESMVSGFRRCRREEGRRVHSVQPPGGLDPSRGCRCFCRVSGPQRRDRAERAFVEPGRGGWFMPRELCDPAASLRWKVCAGERNSPPSWTWPQTFSRGSAGMTQMKHCVRDGKSTGLREMTWVWLHKVPTCSITQRPEPTLWKHKVYVFAGYKVWNS